LKQNGKWAHDPGASDLPGDRFSIHLFSVFKNFRKSELKSELKAE
jgi:hypothetical protein